MADVNIDTDDEPYRKALDGSAQKHLTRALQKFIYLETNQKELIIARIKELIAEMDANTNA